jgi:hypothetical protein
MSHSSTRTHPKRKSAHAASPRASDGAIYIALLMIGAFAVFLAVVLTNQPWQHFAVGYLIAILALVNLFGWKAWAGKHLTEWQQALAKVPLRFAGYGTRGGRPLEAAHGSAAARSALLIFLALSVAIIALGIFLVIR